VKYPVVALLVNNVEVHALNYTSAI